MLAWPRSRGNTQVASVAPVRTNLISKEMIHSPTYGETASTVPLFDAFIRREMPDLTGGRAAD